MDNQTTSTALAPLIEGEEKRVREFYCMIRNKSGNIKFDLFWRCLRNCFDKDDSSAHDKASHHAMVAFEKLEGKYPPTIDKRTQLTGNLKLGPEKRKREDDNPESTSDKNCFVTNKRFNDLFSFVGQLVKTSNLQKENQGQGRRGNRDRGYYKERNPNRRPGGGDCKPQSREYDEPRQYSNTATVSGQRSGKSGKGVDKHGSSGERGGEDTHHFAHLAFEGDVFSGFNRERKSNI